MNKKTENQEDIVETIVILCENLDPDRLDQVWKKAYDLALEKMEAKASKGYQPHHLDCQCNLCSQDQFPYLKNDG